MAPDWINYAILDEITDHFAPHIQQLGAEVDDIDDPATLLAVKDDETEIVLRISACRKRVMQLIRLLSTKADVVRVLIKRSESASSSSSSSSTPSFSSSSSFCDKSSSTAAEFIPTHRRGGSSSSLFGFFKDRTQQSSPPPPPAHAYHGRRRSSFQVLEEASNGDRMYPDTALYLGDVQGKLSYLFCCAYVTILTKKAKFHCRPLDNYASESRPLRNRACTCTFQLPCSDLDTTVTNFQFDQPCYWKIDRVCYYFVTNESYYWSLG